MAYKLYINNKLFNGIGNNNYNKGTIAINGTIYQFDNSSGSSLPTYTFYWKKTTSGNDLDYTSPNYFKFTSDSNSSASKFGGVATSINETMDGITFQYAGNTNSNTRCCEILLSDFISDNSIDISDYDISVDIYINASSSYNIKIGNDSVQSSIIGFNKYSGTIDETNNIINIYNNSNRWCGIYVTLTPKS